MPDDLEQTIRDNAAGPSKTAIDGESVEQHPLPDQIAADRYLRSQQATRSKNLGLKFTKVVPPGAE